MTTARTTDGGRSGHDAASVTTVLLGGPICRRCGRRISRWVSDVPGVVALEGGAAGVDTGGT